MRLGVVVYNGEGCAYDMEDWRMHKVGHVFLVGSYVPYIYLRFDDVSLLR